MSHQYTIQQVASIQRACAIAARCMEKIAAMIRPGVTTAQLDEKAYTFIRANDAEPNFLNLYGFPASICASVNNEVVHGIPSARVLQEGDIISIDLGARYEGFNSDMARTFCVGEVSAEAQELIAVTEQCFYEALKVAYPGNTTGDIGYAVQSLAEKHRYGVVRSLCGHGVGMELHEDPEVPNFGRRGRGEVLKPGMVLAIEPMINLGTERVRFLKDGTVVTGDGKISAHYENTIVITQEGPVVLTK